MNMVTAFSIEARELRIHTRVHTQFQPECLALGQNYAGILFVLKRKWWWKESGFLFLRKPYQGISEKFPFEL
jgi:hypothetical protein